jgi:hypothetical protein
VVYGVWAYPAFPPFFFVPDPVFFVGPVGVGISFGVGFGVVGPFWGWGHPVWGEGHIFIDGGRWSRISFQHAAFAGSTFHHAGAIGRAQAGVNAGAGRFAGGRFGVGRNSVARSSAARSIGRASAGRGVGRHAAAHSSTHAGSHGARSVGHTAGGRSGMVHHASSHAGGGFHQAARASRSGASHGGNQHRH